MTLQRRFALGTAGLVALGVGAGLVGAWFVVGAALRHEIDTSLAARASAFHRRFLPPRSLPPRFVAPPRLGAATTYVQFVRADGSLTRPGGQGARLPVAGAVAVASGRRRPFFRDATVDGVHVRIYVERVRSGTAVEIARPLTEIDHVLGRLRYLFLGVWLLTVAAGVAVAFAFARRVLQPVRALTRHAERLAETGDLTQRADASRADELGRLAGAFNTMLVALDRSLRVQRQLVADASHELRTPLAVTRTNLDVLQRHDELSAAQRRQVVAEALEEVKEMTDLIDELVALARGDVAGPEPEPIRLDAVVEEAAEVAARRSGRDVQVTAVPSTVSASPASLARAVANLIDNAVKWGPPDTPVEVAVADGVVRVRDHGPGVAAEDAPHVFDRFYRASAARTLPGSGLGLAIVRQVAEAHGGTVSVGDAPGGGAVFTLVLPTIG